MTYVSPSELRAGRSDAIALRVNAACAMLGVGRSTFYKLVKQGRLQVIRLNGRTLVPRSELDRIVDEQLHAARAGKDGQVFDRASGEKV